MTDRQYSRARRELIHKMQDVFDELFSYQENVNVSKAQAKLCKFEKFMSKKYHPVVLNSISSESLRGMFDGGEKETSEGSEVLGIRICLW